MVDVFQKLQKKYVCHFFHIDPIKFLIAPALALQATFKKTGIKPELLTHIDMLLMIEKKIRGEICRAIH